MFKHMKKRTSWILGVALLALLVPTPALANNKKIVRHTVAIDAPKGPQKLASHGEPGYEHKTTWIIKKGGGAPKAEKAGKSRPARIKGVKVGRSSRAGRPVKSKRR
jgi:hypothetical protein